MPRCRSLISALRSWLYWLARALGDYQAVRRGPEAVVKRLARRQAGRITGRWLGRLFRSSMCIRLLCSPRVREMQAWRGVSKVLTGTGYLSS
jgi:hypothetical protein